MARRKKHIRAKGHKKASKAVSGLKSKVSLGVTSYSRGSKLPTVAGNIVNGGRKRIRGGLKVF